MARSQHVEGAEGDTLSRALALFFFVLLVLFWLVGNVFANMQAIYAAVEWADTRNGAASIGWVNAGWASTAVLILSLVPSAGQAFYQHHRGLHRLEGMKRALPILLFILPMTIIDLAGSTVGTYTGAFSMPLDSVHYVMYGASFVSAFASGILAQGAAHELLVSHILPAADGIAVALN